MGEFIATKQIRNSRRKDTTVSQLLWSPDNDSQSLLV